MSQSKGQLESDCTERCKSAQHGNELISVISKRGVSDVELCAYIRWKCCACGQVLDSMGRTALHFAASCGRTQLVKWLVRSKGAQINAKDLESGYTALHRSVFYGKINAAVALIQIGANVNIVDHNDLTAFEHAMKDRISLAEFSLASACQAYVWGTNTNYTLGTGSQHARQLPELLDAFHKKYTNVSVKQICLHKFHCILVSKDGRVFTCGHGQGGRLGLNSENTVLVPQEVKFNSSGTTFACMQTSIGRDHSLFLSETGQVWSCGLNSHHVLGIRPAPAQLLVPRPLSEIKHELTGICTGRFHSVAWGPTVVLTWGLHAGQLGHERSTNTTFVTPKQVATLILQDTQIVSVAASDGATVVATKRGDIYVLHEYQHRKIASKLLNIEKIVVVGGHLNSKLSSDILVERSGNELKILVLQATGNLMLWQESWPQLSRCIYTLNRPLVVRDAILSRTELFFVTNDGEAFKGEFRTRKKKLQDSGPLEKKSAFHEFLDKDDCQIVKVTKFPHVHRAVSIQCDLKGRNFAVLQNDPRFLLLDVPEISPSTIKEDMLNLLNDSSEMDAIHDVVFKVSGQTFPAHRYIIALKSEPLNSLIESNNSENIIELINIDPVIFKQIILYIYTGTCDIVTSGECPLEIKRLCNNIHKNKSEGKDFDDDFINVDENKSAFEIYNKKQKNKMKNKENANKVDDSRDPVRLLQQAAKRFGVKSLYQKLDNYVYADGFIQLKTQKKQVVECNKFDRSLFTNLQDVVIKSKSGKEIPAHKCILAARLEYFNNLFAVRWNETSTRSVISLPISYSILDQIIDFLYTDESKDLENSDDIDHISNVLIVSDQLFIDRLKEICEVALSNLITLRNASQMLQFASIYNAIQLKHCTMEFVCLNLSAMLESRILETVDPEVLDELTDYYCNWNPILCKRVITPYFDAPCDEVVKSICDSFPVKIEDSDQENNSKKTPKISGKKKVRTWKSSNSENTRNKTTSESNFDSSFENNISVNVSLEKTKIDNKSDEKWVKILTEKEKHQKIVQARLKAIASAKEEVESEKQSDNFLTKLVSTPKIIPKNESPRLAISSSPITSPIFTRSPIVSPNNSQFSFDQARSPPTYEIPIQITQKLSQKQRKKLAAQSSMSFAQQLDKLNKKPSWNTLVTSNESSSFADIIKTDGRDKEFPDLNAGSSSPKGPWQKVEVPLLATSPESKQNFLDIVAHEKTLKENWTKMRTRPLFYTQMEDKAVRELERFYNVEQVSDEYITIHKVEKGAFATPQWVHTNAKH